MEMMGRPAIEPTYAMVPAPMARTGWPGVVVRSTPRWPADQICSGRSKPAITLGGVTGQTQNPRANGTNWNSTAMLISAACWWAAGPASCPVEPVGA